MGEKTELLIIVFFISIALTSSYFYLNPSVTGYYVFKNNYHSTSLSLTVNSDSKQIIGLEAFGELKSLMLNGRIDSEGYARVYVKNNDEEHLIFDNAKLGKGLGEATGLLVLNNTVVEEYKPMENKSIKIDLEYKGNSDLDTDNNGIETLNGVVDLTVESSMFSWDVDETKLCARWQVYSLDKEEITVVCHGSEQCCNFVELSPISEKWNDVFYLYYNSHGSTFDNHVIAQVLYVDYNLSLENPYAYIYYSESANLPAKFISDKGIMNYRFFQSGIELTSFKPIINENDTIIIEDNSIYSVDSFLNKKMSFNARLTDELKNHVSWQLGGFAGTDEELVASSDERAVFYVDIGVMKAFVRSADRGISWCKPMLYDWLIYHNFSIEVDNEHHETIFYIDGNKECTIKRTVSTLPIMLGENDKIGGIEMLASAVQVY